MIRIYRIIWSLNQSMESNSGTVKVIDVIRGWIVPFYNLQRRRKVRFFNVKHYALTPSAGLIAVCFQPKQ